MTNGSMLGGGGALVELSREVAFTIPLDRVGKG